MKSKLRNVISKHYNHWTSHFLSISDLKENLTYYYCAHCSSHFGAKQCLFLYNQSLPGKIILTWAHQTLQDLHNKERS